jgi:hypothetical protein
MTNGIYVKFTVITLNTDFCKILRPNSSDGGEAVGSMRRPLFSHPPKLSS